MNKMALLGVVLIALSYICNTGNQEKPRKSTFNHRIVKLYGSEGELHKEVKYSKNYNKGKLEVTRTTYFRQPAPNVKEIIRYESNYLKDDTTSIFNYVDKKGRTELEIEIVNQDTTKRIEHFYEDKESYTKHYQFTKIYKEHPSGLRKTHDSIIIKTKFNDNNKITERINKIIENGIEKLDHRTIKIYDSSGLLSDIIAFDAEMDTLRKTKNFYENGAITKDISCYPEEDHCLIVIYDSDSCPKYAIQKDKKAEESDTTFYYCDSLSRISKIEWN